MKYSDRFGHGRTLVHPVGGMKVALFGVCGEGHLYEATTDKTRNLVSVNVTSALYPEVTWHCTRHGYRCPPAEMLCPHMVEVLAMVEDS